MPSGPPPLPPFIGNGACAPLILSTLLPVFLHCSQFMGQKILVQIARDNKDGKGGDGGKGGGGPSNAGPPAAAGWGWGGYSAPPMPSSYYPPAAPPAPASASSAYPPNPQDAWAQYYAQLGYPQQQYQPPALPAPEMATYGSPSGGGGGGRGDVALSLANLPPNYRDQDVTNMFQCFQGLTGCQVHAAGADGTASATVHFSTAEQARLAQQTMNDFMIGAYRLRCTIKQSGYSPY